MCGIAGLLDPTASAEELSRRTTEMAATMAHRGPDGQGVWTDPSVGLGLGHRRLSILDPRPEGAQPMVSADGRVVVSFNGEIYNWGTLRRRLVGQGCQFRTHTDTEVLAEGISRWGIQQTLELANGMFALSVWQPERGTLTLARDRMGEKPLYYGSSRGRFFFASELKALHAHPAFDARIDQAALGGLLRYGYVPEPLCIYEGVAKLPPGTTLTIAVAATLDVGHPIPYWSLAEVADRPRGALSVHDLLTGLEQALEEAVSEQMVADVPIGAFLSGGIDSSLIVATMQRLSSQPVRTFTIGFEEPSYDEATFAKTVAGHLGTTHTELYVTPEEARQVIPKLPTMYDEPFADSSQIPTYLVAALTRGSVTVSLSGDGGDELFAGYQRYAAHDRYWRAAGALPSGLRRALGAAILHTSQDRWDLLGSRLAGILPSTSQLGPAGHKLHRLAAMLRASGPAEGWELRMSQWPQPAELIGPAGHTSALAPLLPAGLSELERVTLLDALSYLPGDVLHKVDRAAMSVSLETRVPLLDRRVVEAAWRFPPDLKVRDGVAKWPLRHLLAKHVPAELFERPKMGFGVPIGRWLRGPLHDWAADLLDPTMLRRQGLIDPEPVWRCWQEHQAGTRDWQYRLWTVLMFQAWHEQWHGR